MVTAEPALAIPLREPIIMSQISIREAEVQLSSLIERACQGEEILIAEAGVPVARLSAVTQSRVGRRFGALAGRARVDERFFDPLPKSELQAWEG
ncbi:Antitoxin of toxin-antitoxin stability system [Thiorhodovibrio frisius]|nr:Antitoxin of toxin-antitoxin stability system [Thiorhodovibrio frisius]